MKTAILREFKRVLTTSGAHVSPGLLREVQASINYLKLGRWMRDKGFNPGVRCQARQQVWDQVICQLANEKVLYLEFGVAYGDSISYWSHHLNHPDSILHGFDSFEGLPEDAGPWTKGQFDAKGCLPDINDRRVQFFKGWFNQVLPTYNIPPHEQLIINLDADLYSSTSYVLSFLRPWIRRGTLIYFDELNHVDHEARAFAEFIEESGLRFKLLAADKTLAFAFFECLG